MTSRDFLGNMPHVRTPRKEKTVARNKNYNKGTNWPTGVEDDLLHILFFEKVKGNMPDDHFKKGIWKSVAEQLTCEGINEITADKVRQHFKYLKSKYQAYASLGNKSGWGWDSENNMPVADDAQWKGAIKANKKLSMCRQP